MLKHLQHDFSRGVFRKHHPSGLPDPLPDIGVNTITTNFIMPITLELFVGTTSSFNKKAPIFQVASFRL